MNDSFWGLSVALALAAVFAFAVFFAAVFVAIDIPMSGFENAQDEAPRGRDRSTHASMQAGGKRSNGFRSMQAD
ncbi:hypothetical protein [Paraburkholderia azotifigens]|uniref:hypothetical protein n=1 Tax=Paraburkholderia azotifigens TaxID=2057004 RepID=UPI001EFFFE99|nr:hypothetical protein [Paraburkholderia azotifigens]